MKKIPCMFERDFTNNTRLVLPIQNPAADWVFREEGVATRKYDGTACLVRDGKLFKRYDAKKGRTPPEGFEPCGEPDPITGHHPGWVPVISNPADRYYQEASIPLENGTYELCGPKFQGNPEKLLEHTFVKHGEDIVHDCPRDYEGLKNFLKGKDIEGIVFHHPDGRMAKIRLVDFGLKRGQQ